MGHCGLRSGRLWQDPTRVWAVSLTVISVKWEYSLLVGAYPLKDLSISEIRAVCNQSDSFWNPDSGLHYHYCCRCAVWISVTECSEPLAYTDLQIHGYSGSLNAFSPLADTAISIRCTGSVSPSALKGKVI
jgi:hypothetical protein